MASLGETAINVYTQKLQKPSKIGTLTIFSDLRSKEPVCLNHFYKPKMSSPTNPEDFKRQKFDFHETYEKNCSPSQPYVTPLPGLGNLYRGLKTADLYNIDPALPLRFREPDLLQGYGCERPENPLFRTTSSEYGKLAPTVHDVPVEYHGLKNTFTSHLASTGMPRNRSLNIK